MKNYLQSKLLIIFLISSIVITLFLRFNTVEKNKIYKEKKNTNAYDASISLKAFMKDLIWTNFSNQNFVFDEINPAEDFIILVVNSPICDNCVFDILKELQKMDMKLYLMVDTNLFNNFRRKIAFLKIPVDLFLHNESIFFNNITMILKKGNKDLILPLPQNNELEFAQFITSSLETDINNN